MHPVALSESTSTTLFSRDKVPITNKSIYSAIEFYSLNAKRENSGIIIFLPESFAYRIFRDNSLKVVQLNDMQRKINVRLLRKDIPLRKHLEGPWLYFQGKF